MRPETAQIPLSSLTAPLHPEFGEFSHGLLDLCTIATNRAGSFAPLAKAVANGRYLRIAAVDVASGEKLHLR